MEGLSQITLNDHSQPVLLAVLAHPDDETFGTGGTLALYARRGVKVYLVCGTRGEVGEMDPKYMEGYHSIAERRESELRCAAQTLGLADVFFLGYRDSGMPGSPDNIHPNALAAAPFDEVAAKITHYIRKVHPQVVITFDPIGGYRHPDHIATHKATVKAFEAAGQAGVYPDPEHLPPYAPKKLYFTTFSRTFLRVSIAAMRLAGRDPRRFGINQDVDLASIAAVSFPITTRIDYKPVREIRDHAAGCHASQGGGAMGSGFQGWIMRRFRGDDTYMRARPEIRKGERPERDLFAGI